MASRLKVDQHKSSHILFKISKKPSSITLEGFLIQMLSDKKLISKYRCYIIFVEFIDFTAESAVHLKRTALLFDDI